MALWSLMRGQLPGQAGASAVFNFSMDTVNASYERTRNSAPLIANDLQADFFSSYWS
ncbi:hypothetical protein JHK87_039407 [Glycine soja]|nr:hypothetical protein JHK87_039407 [Glycine soja]